MSQIEMPDLVVRKMPFEFPEDIDASWNKAKPEWSHMVNGTSLAMPFLEPYLIRTMRKALVVPTLALRHSYCGTLLKRWNTGT